MKISTKGRYALRLMLEIALGDAQRPVRIKEIAKKQDISDKYLEQIVSVLNKSGMVKSIRGAQGGYLLAKRPDEYTVGDILRLTEGSMDPVDEGDAEDFATAIVWKRLGEAINDVIDGITLADLVDWQLARSGDYSI